jgi:hypothetical protein
MMARLELMVVTFMSEDGRISVPGWVVGIGSFRRWTDGKDFPNEGRIWWLCGEVWADMIKEHVFRTLPPKPRSRVSRIRFLGGLLQRQADEFPAFDNRRLFALIQHCTLGRLGGDLLHLLQHHERLFDQQTS